MCPDPSVRRFVRDFTNEVQERASGITSARLPPVHRATDQGNSQRRGFVLDATLPMTRPRQAPEHWDERAACHSEQFHLPRQVVAPRRMKTARPGAIVSAMACRARSTATRPPWSGVSVCPISGQPADRSQTVGPRERMLLRFALSHAARISVRGRCPSPPCPWRPRPA